VIYRFSGIALAILLTAFVLGQIVMNPDMEDSRKVMFGFSAFMFVIAGGMIAGARTASRQPRRPTQTHDRRGGGR